MRKLLLIILLFQKKKIFLLHGFVKKERKWKKKKKDDSVFVSAKYVLFYDKLSDEERENIIKIFIKIIY